MKNEELEELEELQTFVGPFVGWKVLEYVGMDGPVVRSPYRTMYNWLPLRTTIKADCRVSDSSEIPPETHGVPRLDCTCGYYAYVDFRSADRCRKLFNGVVEMNFEFIVLVVGWGKTVTHEKGWRSAEMEVMAIHNGPYRYRDSLESLARNLAIPYMTQNEMEDHARELGVVLTKDTIP